MITDLKVVVEYFSVQSFYRRRFKVGSTFLTFEAVDWDRVLLWHPRNECSSRLAVMSSGWDELTRCFTCESVCSNVVKSNGQKGELHPPPLHSHGPERLNWRRWIGGPAATDHTSLSDLL
eukprot:81454-Rhodomonas_salina.2